jgi:hypothetical protein
MEITRPGNTASDPWFVTNGLLVWEMVAGQVQRWVITPTSR